MSAPAHEIRAWVEGSERPLVIGWPFDGTRRWYLSYCANAREGQDYLRVLTRRQAEIARMMFAHGVQALLVPLFGYALLARGEEYAAYGLSGLTLLGEDSEFGSLREEGVRIRFYGQYEKPLAQLGMTHLIDFCKELESKTSLGSGPLLLIGLFAENPYDFIANYSVEFAKRSGRPPNRTELIEAYYGGHVPDLSLYIGYGQHGLFDVPLLPTGYEDLYATLNPSPALTERQLREVLYDHFVTRPTASSDYEELPQQARSTLASYVTLYEGITLGLGRIDRTTNTWVPLLPTDPLEP